MSVCGAVGPVYVGELNLASSDETIFSAYRNLPELKATSPGNRRSNAHEFGAGTYRP